MSDARPAIAAIGQLALDRGDNDPDLDRAALFSGQGAPKTGPPAVELSEITTQPMVRWVPPSG
jgi:hypothetical protein